MKYAWNKHFVAGLTLLIGWTAFPALQTNASEVQRILTNDKFSQRFRLYQQRTTSYSGEQLLASLSSALEDIFLDVAQIAPAGLDSEVQYFQDTLLSHLRLRLCSGRRGIQKPSSDWQPAIIQSTTHAADELSVEFGPSAYGRIAGITSNLLKPSSGFDLCQR